MKKKKRELSQRDRFWSLFDDFVLGMRKTETYTEIMARAAFFCENQKVIKKVPPSASAEKAAFLHHGRRCFWGTPTTTPATILDYKKQLVRSLDRFRSWLQDEFDCHAISDGQLNALVCCMERTIWRRFSEINPENAAVENLANVAKACAQTRSSFFFDACEKLDSWRAIGENNEVFRSLQAVKDYDLGRIDGKKTSRILAKISQSGEGYAFNFDGKETSKIIAKLDDAGVMVPCPEESKHFSTTENLYIEGNNLRALRLLLDNYREKINMIYIDPPYNTGHKFVYNDRFGRSAESEIYTRLFYRRIPACHQ